MVEMVRFSFFVSVYGTLTDATGMSCIAMMIAQVYG